MLTFIQLNYGWILAIGGIIITLGKILLHFRDRIKTHDDMIKQTDKTLCDHKTESEHKFKILEDSIRSRDEAILNKLDAIAGELSEMKISNAKLVGVLAGKGVIKSEDI